MRARIRCRRWILGCFVILAVSSAWAGETSRPFVPGELVLSFAPGAEGDDVVRLQTMWNVRLVRTLYGSAAQLWSVPEGQEETLADALESDRAVRYAEPNYLYGALLAPNDPSFGSQWALAKIHSTAAWDLETGSGDVIVAVIDTGIDESHPDLAAKIVAGHDFVDADADPHDLNGHGTHVAGIAAASTDNSVGIAGMDWGARIMPIRVLGADGSGSGVAITEGITWAYQHGADVLNLSLGGTSFSQAMQDAVQAAHDAGALVVAAMGNYRSYGNPTSYPAAYADVMAVAATAPDDTYSYYSQYGPHCDISAPGGEMGYLHDPDGILSTMPTYVAYMNTEYSNFQNYDRLQGTSQASPLVAGLAALVRARAPTLGPDDVQELIERTAKDLGAVGWDPDYGFGRIDAFAALDAMLFVDGFEQGTLDDWDAVVAGP